MAVTANYGFTKPTVAGDAGVWGGFLNTDLDSIDLILAVPKINWTTPTYNVGGTTTCDCGISRVFALTVSGASTLAFSNVPSASFDAKVTLRITNGSAFVLTFPASVTWLAGIAPTFKASGVDFVDLETTDAGTTWYATIRNLRPGVLFTDTNKSTTSTSEVSVTSYVLPANALSVDGMSLRITSRVNQATQAGTVKIKFGATQLEFATPAAGEGNVSDIIVTRTGAAIQRWQIISGHSALAGGVITFGHVGSSAAETLSGAITIDFRGSVTSGGTLTYESIVVELLARS